LSSTLEVSHKLVTWTLDAQTDQGPDPFAHIPGGRIKLQGPVFHRNWVSGVSWDDDLSKSAAKDGGTYILGMGMSETPRYAAGLIIQPTKAEAAQFMPLGVIEEDWIISVEMDMK
jgi:hypothetical protein